MLPRGDRGVEAQSRSSSSAPSSRVAGLNTVPEVTGQEWVDKEPISELSSVKTNRLDLGNSKIIQLDRIEDGYVIRLLESGRYIKPRISLHQAHFDTLVRQVDTVDLGWITLQRMDRALWVSHQERTKLWAEVSWAQFWRLAQSET